MQATQAANDFPVHQRHAARVAIVAFVVVLMVAAMALIAAWGYRSNRVESFDLAQRVLEQLERRLAVEVQAFLAPPERVTRLSHDALSVQPGDTALSALATPVERFALSTLREYSQLASLLFADPQGNFVMYRRTDDDSVDTRLIERGPTGEVVRAGWIRRNRDGLAVSFERTEDDGYDPRKRSWYVGANDGQAAYWSGVYVFFSDQSPGVTAALARDAVTVGLDIRIEQLSELLGGLDVPGNGTVLIVDNDGTLVALDDPAKVLQRRDGELKPRHIDTLGNLVLSRAWSQHRVRGSGALPFRVNGIDYIASTRSLHKTVGRHWTVLSVAPEDALAGFTARNSLGTLVLAVVVLLLAAVLGIVLVRQGRRADRAYVQLLDHEQSLETRSRAFAAIAEHGALFDPRDEGDLGGLAELVSNATGARRVSIWRYNAAVAQLNCRDCYDASTGGHTHGMVVDKHNYAALIAALTYSDELLVPDCSGDPRTEHLHETYLSTVHCNTLVAVPARARRELLGALLLEDDDAEMANSESAVGLARMMGRLLQMRWMQLTTRAEGSDSTTTGAGTMPDAPALTPLQGANSALSEERRIAMLGAQRVAAFRAAVGNDVGSPVRRFEHAVVMNMRLTEPLSLLEPSPGDADGTPAIGVLVQRIEALAERQQVEYLKVQGDEIVFASGLDQPRDAALAAAADLALAMRAQCAHIFTGADQRLDFRIGLDAGPVVGCVVGREGRVFNLWGEPIRTANELAASGEPGGIVASAEVYLALNTAYLFNVRGHYFIPDVGEIPVYELGSRL